MRKIIISIIVTSVIWMIVLIAITRSFALQYQVDGQKIDFLYNQLEKAKEKLDEYHATEVELIRLGATPTLAKQMIKAAEVNQVGPKSLGALGCSETHFTTRTHANPDWVGYFGVNVPVWAGICPFDPSTDAGNAMSAAWILKYYLDLSNGRYIDAFHRYKSHTELGRKYAERVVAIRKGME